MILEYQFFTSIIMLNFYDLSLNSSFNINFDEIYALTILEADYIALGSSSSEIYIVNIFNSFDYCIYNKIEISP